MIFWGTDAGEVEARDMTMHQHFARSMSLQDAMNPDYLLAYEMNGEALPIDHGSPLRLIAPNWYGAVNVKWLKRIEVMDQHLETQFMARDFVTVRQAERDGEIFWTETAVRHMRLKSAPARVTKAGDAYRITGAAWGAPIAKVEVRIDDGEWPPRPGPVEKSLAKKKGHGSVKDGVKSFARVLRITGGESVAK